MKFQLRKKTDTKDETYLGYIWAPAEQNCKLQVLIQMNNKAFIIRYVQNRRPKMFVKIAEFILNDVEVTKK